MVVVKEEVRTHIVGVARKIFTRNGFRKTTMEEIAGVSQKGKSSIYYYFNSKEEIFRAVVEKEARELKVKPWEISTQPSMKSRSPIWTLSWK
jgi:AcrR family transcriptional regulator